MMEAPLEPLLIKTGQTPVPLLIMMEAPPLIMMEPPPLIMMEPPLLMLLEPPLIMAGLPPSAKIRRRRG
jgi:hypothetical protein